MWSEKEIKEYLDKNELPCARCHKWKHKKLYAKKKRVCNDCINHQKKSKNNEKHTSFFGWAINTDINNNKEIPPTPPPTPVIEGVKSPSTFVDMKTNVIDKMVSTTLHSDSQNNNNNNEEVVNDDCNIM